MRATHTNLDYLIEEERDIESFYEAERELLSYSIRRRLNYNDDSVSR